MIVETEKEVDYYKRPGVDAYNKVFNRIEELLKEEDIDSNEEKEEVLWTTLMTLRCWKNGYKCWLPKKRATKVVALLREKAPSSAYGFACVFEAMCENGVIDIGDVSAEEEEKLRKKKGMLDAKDRVDAYKYRLQQARELIDKAKTIDMED